MKILDYCHVLFAVERRIIGILFSGEDVILTEQPQMEQRSWRQEILCPEIPPVKYFWEKYGYSVHCMTPKCGCRVAHNGYKTLEEAIDSWNSNRKKGD